jgi:hypothetical protein
MYVYWKRINQLHKDVVLLETLGLVLKVGTCHYTWIKKELSAWKWAVFLILSDFCFHNTKCPSVFVRLETMAGSVVTDFKHFNMCMSKKDGHYIWKLVAKEMKSENDTRSVKENFFHHFWANWDLTVWPI